MTRRIWLNHFSARKISKGSARLHKFAVFIDENRCRMENKVLLSFPSSMRNTAASWVTPGGPVRDEESLSIDDRFLAFHAAHPEVYAELASLARIAIAQGRRQIGVRMLWEVMRWNLSVVRGRKITLNDHFHSRYARLLMEQEKDLRGIFSLRQLRGEE